jgi:hypothetical protein
VNAFFNDNENNVSDVIYCHSHKTILACDDKILALIIHKILYSATADKSMHIQTPAARDQWEQHFCDQYITPAIKSVERAEPEEK